MRKIDEKIKDKIRKDQRNKELLYFFAKLVSYTILTMSVVLLAMEFIEWLK